MVRIEVAGKGTWRLPHLEHYEPLLETLFRAVFNARMDATRIDLAPGHVLGEGGREGVNVFSRSVDFTGNEDLGWRVLVLLDDGISDGFDG